jgi:hypothetical protein
MERKTASCAQDAVGLAMDDGADFTGATRNGRPRERRQCPAGRIQRENRQQRSQIKRMQLLFQ